nr:hypothetical protein [uncultured Shinella sp.]
MVHDAVNKALPGEVLEAYLEWLAMEARLLRIELYGDEYFANRELTPCNTFAHSFHFPADDRTWEDVPKPSTRAVQVLRSAGVDMPEVIQ